MNLRLLALTVALPLAVASAGPVGHGTADGAVLPASGRSVHALPNPAGDSSAGPDDTPPPPSEPRTTRLLGIGLATAARCGPALLSRDGIEAQTCVMTQGRETWARTYYRNATGNGLSSALSLMVPDGRTVLTRCAVPAAGEPGVCETPRESTAGEAGAYQAVAEFAGATGRGPLLLRSGSNSAV